MRLFSTALPVPEFENSWKSVDVPWWAWLNLLSLDAVLVGVCWSTVFTLDFCQRMPQLYELSIIGLSIWLVYVADRLLDSAGLDCQREHTMRHRLHFEYRGRILFAWLIALVIDVLLVVCCANESQVRWGLLAIVFLVAYLTCVHLTGIRSDWFPKELRAGLVFAFGISLPGWVQSGGSDVGGVLAATLMSGILFATNCLVIACWERDSDACQGFGSYATRMDRADVVPGRVLSVHLGLNLLLYSTGLLGARIAVCLVAADCLLLLVLFLNRQYRHENEMQARNPVPVNLFSLLADASLAVPTAVFVLLSARSDW